MTPRLLLSLLLLIANNGKNWRGGHLAVGLPAAHAFAPPTFTKDVSTSKNSVLSIRTRRDQQQREIDSALRIDNSSDNEPVESTKNNDKGYLIPMTGLVSLSLATLAAFTQNLPGPPIDATAPPPFLGTLPFGVFFAGSCDPYSPELILRDAASTLLCVIGAGIFVKSITIQAKVGNLEPRDSRKLIHTCSAPLFILLWPIFSNAFGARVFASIVPLLNAVRLFVAGTGGNEQSTSPGSESELAGAISRSGDANEVLGGPFIYVLVLLFATLVCWTDSPIGIVAVATMAVGDGLADLIGRRFGSSNKWSFNKSKSMAGSAAFVAGSFVGSYGLLSWLISMGAMEPMGLSTTALAVRLLAIAVISAGVELIPFGDDNWSVPLAAALLSAFLLQ